jgi:prophage DNA circulation protein
MSDFASIYGDYGDQAAAAIRSRANKRIANQQAVFYGQKRGSRALEDLGQKFAKGFAPQVSQMQRRGLKSSGITRRALADYANQYQRSVDAQTMQNALDMQGLSDSDTAAEDALQEYLAQLRFKKQREVLATASDLSNIGQFGG